MAERSIIPAALALDGVTAAGARAGFDIAAANGFRGIAFATNHAELNPEQLGESARRHLRTILSGKGLRVEALRAAAPRGGLFDTATIDRTLENSRKAMQLAHELGVRTVAVNIGSLARPKEADGVMPGSSVVAALRELAQQADAFGLTLAIGAEAMGGPRADGGLGAILKEVDYEHARVNLDGARAIAGAEDPLRLAEEFAGRIGQVTAADAIRTGRSVRATMLGEGQLPLVELLDILREQGFDGPMVVDVRDLPDGAAGAGHAAAVLRRIVRG